jgi:sRNA-binding protein
MLETPIDQPSPAPSGKEKSPYQADRLRGVKEARTAIEVLKAKWPAIFNDPKNVKPLASSVLPQVAAALGWSLGYTRGVFHVWKSRNDYCRAVLRDSVRVHLDGSPSEEVVDDRAREMAKAQLDTNAARSAARRARELAEMTAKSAE